MIPVAVHRLEVLLPDGTVTSPTSDQGASVTLDMGWSPYVQAQVTIPAPANTAQLDPRGRPRRVRLTATKAHGTSERIAKLTTTYKGKPLSAITTAFSGRRLFNISDLYSEPWNPMPTVAQRRTFDLSIRSRRIDDAEGTVTLTLASDEALLQDYTLIADQDYIPTSLALGQIIDAVLLRTIGARLSSVEGLNPLPQVPTWFRGTSAWDYIQSMVQTTGQRIWCDENRRWHLAQNTFINSSNTWVLDASALLVSADDTVSREGDWADAVDVIYRWTDSENVSHVRHDVAFVEGFTKAIVVEVASAYPGPGAARWILSRARTRGTEQTARGVSNYAISPSGVATLVGSRLDGVQRMVVSTSWAWPADQMTIQLRDPEEKPQ